MPSSKFLVSPDCRCKQGEGCVLVGGKMTDLCAKNMWLPVGYSNRIKGSDWLEGRKTPSEFDYPNRREACKTYLSDIKAYLSGAKSYYNRYNILSVTKDATS